MRSASAAWWAQAAQNRPVGLVLAMVFIVPLVASFTDSSMKGLAPLVFEGFAILLLTLLLWRVRWDLRRETILAFLKTGVHLPVLLLLGLVLLSCAFSPNRAYSAQEALRLGAGVLLYFAAACQFRRSEQLFRLTDMLLLVAFGASLAGFAGYYVGSAPFADGLFGDHQLFGSFLMILLPVIAVMAFSERNANRQLAAQVAAVLVAACLLLTHTRSAWIGAAAGIGALGALVVFAAVKQGGMAARRHEIIVPLMLIVVATGFFLIVSPQSDSILNRLGTLSQVERERGWLYRQQMWRGTWEMIRQRPLTGVGVGLYPYHQQKYTGMGLPIHAVGGRPSLGEQAHNFYLQLLAELGVPGLLLFLTALAGFLVRGWRRVSQMEAGIRRSLLIGAMASTVAFAVDALGSPAWQYGPVSMFFWLLLGIGVNCMRSVSRRRPDTSEPALSPRVTRPVAVLASLALTALLPTVVYAGGTEYARPLRAFITPKNRTVRSTGTVSYRLRVAFNDGSLRDVTLCPRPPVITDFRQIGGQGTMIGVNNHIYQPMRGERSVATITGTFTQSGVTVGDSTSLTVRP